MSRTNVTMQPSKRTVATSAAQIYAGYLAAGWVQPQDDARPWLERAVREAVQIARHVHQTVHSDEELPDESKPRLRDLPEDEDVPRIIPPG